MHALFPIAVTRFALVAASPLVLAASVLQAEEAMAPIEMIEHPALFLVGDSTVKTGTGTGDTGPWGWGAEIGAFFDSAKIHVYNEAHGGRSSRSYIEEGLWPALLPKIQPGDFVIIQFGHNDAANSENYPDRTTIDAGGDETIQLGVGVKRQVVHTYGWYLRHYVADAKSKGATTIICSPVPRNQWVDARIKRGFDGYVRLASDAARASDAWFIDLNAIVSDRYDAAGQEKSRMYFNDVQHSRKAGAHLDAECVVAGIRQLQGCPLAKDLATR